MFRKFHLDVNKLFLGAELLPKSKEKLFSTFIAEKLFSEYTKKEPLTVVAKAIDVFPDHIDEIFNAVTKDFERFAGNLNDLSQLVKLFPTKQEEIFKMALKDTCFSLYYHYGLFSALGQLKTLFPTHYPELSTKSKQVPHIQSLQILRH